MYLFVLLIYGSTAPSLTQPKLIYNISMDNHQENNTKHSNDPTYLYYCIYHTVNLILKDKSFDFKHFCTFDSYLSKFISEFINLWEYNLKKYPVLESFAEYARSFAHKNIKKYIEYYYIFQSQNSFNQIQHLDADFISIFIKGIIKFHKASLKTGVFYEYMNFYIILYFDMYCNSFKLYFSSKIHRYECIEFKNYNLINDIDIIIKIIEIPENNDIFVFDITPLYFDILNRHITSPLKLMIDELFTLYDNISKLCISTISSKSKIHFLNSQLITNDVIIVEVLKTFNIDSQYPMDIISEFHNSVDTMLSMTIRHKSVAFSKIRSDATLKKDKNAYIQSMNEGYIVFIAKTYKKIEFMSSHQYKEESVTGSKTKDNNNRLENINIDNLGVETGDSLVNKGNLFPSECDNFTENEDNRVIRIQKESQKKEENIIKDKNEILRDSQLALLKDVLLADYENLKYLEHNKEDVKECKTKNKIIKNKKRIDQDATCDIGSDIALKTQNEAKEKTDATEISGEIKEHPIFRTEICDFNVENSCINNNTIDLDQKNSHIHDNLQIHRNDQNIKNEIYMEEGTLNRNERGQFLDEENSCDFQEEIEEAASYLNKSDDKLCNPHEGAIKTYNYSKETGINDLQLKLNQNNLDNKNIISTNPNSKLDHTLHIKNAMNQITDDSPANSFITDDKKIARIDDYNSSPDQFLYEDESKEDCKRKGTKPKLSRQNQQISDNPENSHINYISNISDTINKRRFHFINTYQQNDVTINSSIKRTHVYNHEQSIYQKMGGGFSVHDGIKNKGTGNESKYVLQPIKNDLNSSKGYSESSFTVNDGARNIREAVFSIQQDDSNCNVSTLQLKDTSANINDNKVQNTDNQHKIENKIGFVNANRFSLPMPREEISSIVQSKIKSLCNARQESDCCDLVDNEENKQMKLNLLHYSKTLNRDQIFTSSDTSEFDNEKESIEKCNMDFANINSRYLNNLLLENQASSPIYYKEESNNQKNKSIGKLGPNSVNILIINQLKYNISRLEDSSKYVKRKLISLEKKYDEQFSNLVGKYKQRESEINDQLVEQRVAIKKKEFLINRMDIIRRLSSTPDDGLIMETELNEARNQYERDIKHVQSKNEDKLKYDDIDILNDQNVDDFESEFHKIMRDFEIKRVVLEASKTEIHNDLCSFLNQFSRLVIPRSQQIPDAGGQE